MMSDSPVVEALKTSVAMVRQVRCPIHDRRITTEETPPHPDCDGCLEVSYSEMAEKDAEAAVPLAEAMEAEYERLREQATAFIDREREAGWTHFHPEDFCHRCGRPNVPSWFVASPLWNGAMRPQGEASEQWNGIVCPPCFVELYEATTGVKCTRELRQDPDTLHSTSALTKKEEG